MPVSFTHIINPFRCEPTSEHGIASRITNATLARAWEHARAQGIQVEIQAVIAHGDEASILPPAQLAGYLTRTVQDIRPLKPSRPLPLIADILQIGTASASGSHVIFTNMDISVQPDFYVRLAELISERFEPATPFIVYRRNLPAHFTDPAQIEEMFDHPGELATGYDCFVFPREYAGDLELGHSCIGASYFDYLLFMALDAASGFRMQRVRDPALTFHIGNELAWSGQFDYIEHNLDEAITAIRRMRARYAIPGDSKFAFFEREQFRPLTRIDSRILRKFKRIPGVVSLATRAKRLFGRSH